MLNPCCLLVSISTVVLCLTSWFVCHFCPGYLHTVWASAAQSGDGSLKQHQLHAWRIHLGEFSETFFPVHMRSIWFSVCTSVDTKVALCSVRWGRKPLPDNDQVTCGTYVRIPCWCMLICGRIFGQCTFYVMSAVRTVLDKIRTTPRCQAHPLVHILYTAAFYRWSATSGRSQSKLIHWYQIWKDCTSLSVMPLALPCHCRTWFKRSKFQWW